MINATDVQALIAQNLPNAEVYLEGEDGVHFQALVVSDEFEGKTLIQQHRLVYAALEGKIESQEVHALGLKTMTKAQFEKFQAEQQ